MSTQKKLRPFDDLTKEIKVNGKKTIPAEQIAMLCDAFSKFTSIAERLLIR